MKLSVKREAMFASASEMSWASITSLFPTTTVLAKGTLNDLLTRVSLWNNIPKNALLERLR